jgi:pimeloyl-ACP methyl ester carboxylesterase
MSTFVLIHGAWHGGWCWKRVSPLLRVARHEVFTPTLTGLGEREHLMSQDIGLETHIQDVLNVLEFEDLRNVILVGHSYAGMVITGVADRAAERIAHLVYLDAFVPEDGKSLGDYQPSEFFQMFRDKTRAEGAGFKLPCVIPPEAFGITNEQDLAWLRPRLRPHPFQTKLDAIRLTNPSSAHIPRTYIYCNNPAVGVFDQFANRFKHDPAWRYAELATGHDAMVTAADDLAALLLQLVGPR